MNGRITRTRRLGEDGEWVVTLHYFLNGEEVTEAEYRKAIPEQEGVPLFATAVNDAKPWMSDSMAIHPSQIEQAKARNKRHGLNIEYAKDGRPICTDSGQRRKLMKIEGVRQKNSYYGA